jgi:hypothetical protein
MARLLEPNECHESHIPAQPKRLENEAGREQVVLDLADSAAHIPSDAAPACSTMSLPAVNIPAQLKRLENEAGKTQMVRDPTDPAARIPSDARPAGFNMSLPAVPSASSGESEAGARGGTRGSHEAGVTTVVVTKIPKTCERDAVLEIIDACGFRGAYDYFYMPCCFRSRRNLGYAFLNFPEAQRAREFLSTFRGTQLVQGRGGGVDVLSAHVQGFDANVRGYFLKRRHQNINNEQHLPLVFLDGHPCGRALSKEYIAHENFGDASNSARPGLLDS